MLLTQEMLFIRGTEKVQATGYTENIEHSCVNNAQSS